MKSTLNGLLRPLELYTLSLAFIFTSLFYHFLNIDYVDETPIKALLVKGNSILEVIFDLDGSQGYLTSILIIVQCILIAWVALGKEARLATDIFAVFLSFCWLLELVCMNLLLISPILDPVFMLLELLLFVPIMLIGFSWWYWRLNYNQESIRFDSQPTYMSYFIKTACIAVNDTTEHGVCQTDTAKLVRIFNGFVVMDVFGLTLSRAIGLVII